MLAATTTHRPLPRPWTIVAVVAVAGLGCGSTAVDGAQSDAMPETTAEAGATADSGADDSGSGASVDGASSGDVSVLDSATDAGAVAETSASDAPSEAIASDTSPASTWGCAENANLCECYDAHLAPGYTQPTCMKTYPCCVRFSITKSGEAPYHGCDCYSDAYLASIGKTCGDQVDRINAIATYSGAATAPSCPSP